MSPDGLEGFSALVSTSAGALYTALLAAAFLKHDPERGALAVLLVLLARLSLWLYWWRLSRADVYS